MIVKKILPISSKEIMSMQWFGKAFLKGNQVNPGLSTRFLNKSKNFVMHDTAKTSTRVERLLHCSCNLVIIHLWISGTGNKHPITSSSEIAKRLAVLSDCADHRKRAADLSSIYDLVLILNQFFYIDQNSSTENT